MATLTRTIWDTQLGKELERVLPSRCRRAIIDITADDVVKIYAENYDKTFEQLEGTAVFELNWENALSGAVISLGRIEEKKT